MRRRAILGVATLTAAAGLTGIAGHAGATTDPGVPTTSSAVTSANTAMRERPTLFAASAADRFTTRGVVLEATGAAHVHYDRTYHDLPVIGGDVIAHLDGAGALRGTTRSLPEPLRLAVTPGLTAQQAGAAAVAAVPDGHRWSTPPALAVDALGATPVLVWRVEVPTATADGLTGLQHVLVDAATGAVVDAWADEQDVDGTGTGYNVGSVPLATTLSGGTYQLKDPGRGNTYTTDMNNLTSGSGTLLTDADNAWGTGSLTDRQTVAVDAQYGVATTWDYYRTTFGRTGIAGNGAGSYNRVHYGNGYNNAFWSDSCFCMTYGDGDGSTFGPFASLDVAGHEMTHGVTSHTAGLIYSGQSGGLNESMSDIFGTMVEFYADDPADPPDYLIGEKIRKNGTPLRYMDDPARDGHSASCYSSSVGSLNVHYSSGVSNHAFFLLAVGSGAHAVNGVAYDSPTCNGSTVAGIGNAAAAAIFYRALTSYMTSGTSFSGARTATLSAASSLYGSGSAQVAAVAAAWSAVGVG